MAELLYDVEPGWLIAVLTFIVILCLSKIRQLQNKLILEKQKRLHPLLQIKLNTQTAHLLLENVSYCTAHDIQIEDMPFMVDYGFKKKLTLKIEPIERLKPSECVDLLFRIYDGEQDITSTDKRGLIHHIQDNVLEVHLTYKNLENAAFESTITNKGRKFYLKEVKTSEVA